MVSLEKTASGNQDHFSSFGILFILFVYFLVTFGKSYLCLCQMEDKLPLTVEIILLHKYFFCT